MDLAVYKLNALCLQELDVVYEGELAGISALGEH